MKTDTLIAFPEKVLGKSKFPGILTSKVRVNNEVCIAVPLKDLSKFCRLAGLKSTQVKKVKTDYNGIYLASVNGTVSKPKTKKDEIVIMRQNYMKLCGYGRKEEQIKILKKEVSKLSSDIEKYQKNLVESLRNLQENQLGLQRIQNTGDDSLVRFGDEFDQLVKHPDIKNIEIDGNRLLIYTKTINIEYYKSVYSIGKFKITIYTDGGNGCVRMHNLTHRGYDGYNHPYVNDDGQPCLGNIKEVIPHVVSEHKYAAAAAICIQFLKSYERSDGYKPYADITNWPKFKKGEKNEKKK